MKLLKVVKGFQYFESQESDETVLMIVRMHWLVLLAPFVIAVAVAAVLILFAYLTLNNDIVTSFGSSASIQIALYSLIILFVSLYAFSSWLVRYLNALILTNEHIVDVDQIALFSRKIASLDLKDIQDVSVTRQGYWQTLFDYGGILVQTAGEKENFFIDRIPDPEGVLKVIMETRDKYHPDWIRERIENGSLKLPKEKTTV